MTATSVASNEAEVRSGQRFRFGANWARFLQVVDEKRIAAAESSLRAMLAADSLMGKRFLDAGSGSGLFSLAAHRLGASVHSFDYDPESVACTLELKRRFGAQGHDWTIEEGSVLDTSYLERLGAFDVVYCWGVLHHTGSMWDALTRVLGLVRSGGQLYIALYNDQGRESRYWRRVKASYVKFPILRAPLILAHLPYPLLPTLVSRWLRGGEENQRGMTAWHDLIDWIGGYPFEVARPEDVLAFCRPAGFELERLRTTNRLGCNEFVFVRSKVTQASVSGDVGTR